MSSLEVEDKVWVGWPGIEADDLTDDEKHEITTELATRGFVPVFLTKQQLQLFYEGYANDTLWPLFHYFQSYMVHNQDYWKAYREVNKMFANAAKKASEPDATIWVQDYQLMLTPKMIRELLPDASIGYFHHIPFPSYEVFRLLPERKEILEGLLGADLIGFHIYDYARHFLSSCLRLLGESNHYGTLHIDGRIVKADSFPISVDYQKFADMRDDPEVESSRQSTEAAYDTEYTILSIDRLDYSKGIPQRLEAYRLFLENHPQYLGRVKLVMVAVPSRTGVETYKQLRDQIEQSVSRINGTYGTTEWAPISYQFQNLPFHEIVALYSHADVMLVTPIRDGMNLVAKEYIAAKSSAPGVLILSEMAGAIEELPEALSVNPNDALSIERAINTAISMPKKEQQRRLDAMQKRISEYPVTVWANDFLTDLGKVRALQEDAAILNLHGHQLELLVDRYREAKNKLLVLDYDGTLQTFKTSPSQSAAAPSRTLHDLVAGIAEQPNVTVAIVSGRPKSALEEWFGDTKVELIAEHGASVKRDGVWHHQDIEFEDARAVALKVLRDYTSRTPGSRIEQKDYASVWHYRNVPIELAHVRAYGLTAELRAALVDYDVNVHSGNKIIEVKPSKVNKGVAVRRLIETAEADFVLVAGDDYTDEDMFAVASDDDYTIKVGTGETNADYRLASVAAMHRVLQAIAETDG